MGGEANKPKLGDVVSLVRGTTYKSSLLGLPGPVLLGLASIQRNGGFRDDSLKTYGGDSKSSQLLVPGDIFVSLKDVTQSADLLGAVARVPGHVPSGRLTQDTVKLEFRNAEYPRALLYWALRSPQYREYCRGHATGTTNLGLAREDFLGFLLPRPTSRMLSLVGLLESIEGKIELNRKQNETLEAMARAMFKAWFVDFEPVRAKMEGRWQRGQSLPGLPAHLYDLFPDRLLETGAGLIPSAWEFQPLSRFVEILDSRRVPLSGKERAERRGVYPYHGAAGVMGAVDDYLFDGIHVLMGEDGSVVREDGRPVTQYVWGKFWVNNHAHVLRGRGMSSETLLVFLDQCNVASFVTGAVQPKLSQGNLKSIPFLMPGKELLEEFDGVIAPLFGQLRELKEESKSLAQLRDTLLPKLISGELRIPDAERIVGAAA